MWEALQAYVLSRGIGAGNRVEVRVADAARDQAHEHLTSPRPVELHRLDLGWSPELLEHRRTNLQGREA